MFFGIHQGADATRNKSQNIKNGQRTNNFGILSALTHHCSQHDTGNQNHPAIIDTCQYKSTRTGGLVHYTKP